MTAQPFEWIYDGFSFAEGSEDGYKWNVLKVEGLDPPTILADIIKKPGVPGSWVDAGPGAEAERHVIFSGEYVKRSPGDRPYYDMMVTWTNAFAARSDNAWLEGNYPEVGHFHINCKPLNRTFPFDRLSGPGTGKVLWFVEFVAEDPTIYSDD